jgi:hypothetical protein
MSASVRPVAAGDEAWVRETVRARWGEDRAVSRGTVRDTGALPGFIAERDGSPVGLVTYRVAAARAAGAARVSNDNLEALRFYQRRGFAPAALHRDAIAESRRLKPSIAEVGELGIPPRDEIELELRLDGEG